MFETNDYWEEEFTALAFEHSHHHKIYFDNCTFIKCDFSHNIFEHCKFTECVFINCNLSLTQLKNSTFNDVVFKTTNLKGISWSSCPEPFDVQFESCNLSQNSFHLLDLRSTRFVDCLIEDTGFEECNLQHANFSESNLDKSLFVHNNLIEANFETAKNYIIDPKYNDIKDARFSLPEALSFLSLLPIKIK